LQLTVQSPTKSSLQSSCNHDAFFRRRCLCFSIQSSMHLTSHSLIQTQPFFLFGWSFIEPAIEAAIDPMSHCLHRPTSTASSARLPPPPDCDCLLSSTASAARLRLPPQPDCLRRLTATASAARLPPQPASPRNFRSPLPSAPLSMQSMQSIPIDSVDADRYSRSSQPSMCLSTNDTVEYPAYSVSVHAAVNVVILLNATTDSTIALPPVSPSWPVFSFMAAIPFVAGVQFHGRYSFRGRSSVSLPLSVLWPKFIRALLIQQQQRISQQQQRISQQQQRISQQQQRISQQQQPHVCSRGATSLKTTLEDSIAAMPFVPAAALCPPCSRDYD
jgi:hypothetical protein